MQFSKVWVQCSLTLNLYMTDLSALQWMQEASAGLCKQVRSEFEQATSLLWTQRHGVSD